MKVAVPGLEMCVTGGVSPARVRFGGSVAGRAARIGLAVSCAAAWLFMPAPAASQVVTIDSQGRATTSGQHTSVDRRFAQIEPTHVDLPKAELDPKTRQEVIRLMQSEQGFAMRPFPRGHKGLTLVANGELAPAGEAYLSMVTSQGTSAKPGDRVVLTDVKIDHSRIIFDLNGGPDRKHRFLRHVQVGTGPMMNPVVQGDDQEATGARLTLEFKGHIPELTGSQVKALLAPLISFDLKTPIQAYTDTLPPKLKAAILAHHVMVGMSTDMLLFALGQPESKTREMDGQMPFEEWIYGKPPKEVEFVRINGNRVIRVELAKVGETPQIFTKDEVEGLMRTDGSPLEASTTTKTVAMGDVQRDPNTQAPAAPPSLRKDGEPLPQDSQPNAPGAMRPVQFPKQKPDDQPDASKLPRNPKPAAEPADGDDSDDATDSESAPKTSTDPLDQPGSRPGTQSTSAPAPAQEPGAQPGTPPKPH